MMDQTDALSRLQQWARVHCNGKWEFGHGVRIATLENPGWGLTIHIEGTELGGKMVERRKNEKSKDDWISYRVDGEYFEAIGGVSNLTEMIELFLSWAESA